MEACLCTLASAWKWLPRKKHDRKVTNRERDVLLLGDYYQYKSPSIHHNYHWGHSGIVGNQNEGPIPYIGWTHQMDEGLQKMNKQDTP